MQLGLWSRETLVCVIQARSHLDWYRNREHTGLRLIYPQRDSQYASKGNTFPKPGLPDGESFSHHVLELIMAVAPPREAVAFSKASTAF